MATQPPNSINTTTPTPSADVADDVVSASLQLRALELRVIQLHRRMRNFKYDDKDPQKDFKELQETIRKESAEVQESLELLQTWMRDSQRTAAIVPRPFAL